MKTYLEAPELLRKIREINFGSSGREKVVYWGRLPRNCHRMLECLSTSKEVPAIHDTSLNVARSQYAIHRRTICCPRTLSGTLMSDIRHDCAS
jgi:hypothetical protein